MTPEAYLDALMSLPGLYAPKVSRDGRWVAWSWIRVSENIEVFYAPTDGGSAPVQLTQTDETTFIIGWLPDSSGVIVAQDTDGNEREQFFRVDLNNPLHMHPLTEAEPNYFIRGGDLHPNGHDLVYGANFDVATGAEIEPTWIYRHNLQTGERTPIAKPSKGSYVIPELSPDGQHVIYNRADHHPAGRQVWLVDIDGTQDREILNFGDNIKCDASWFPDSQRLVVIADTPTHKRLGVWTLGAGPNAVTWLIDDPARGIEGAFVPYGSDEIVVVEVQSARPQCSLLNPATGTETPFPAIPGNLTPLAPVGDGAWLARYYSSRQPTDVVHFTLDALAARGTDAFTSISRVWERTTLTPDDLTQAEDYRWQSVDGLAIHGWLYRTPAEPARGTVLYIHGGPTAHSSDTINAQIQYFVRAGYNVLDPNYRGSTGYGLEFREKIKEDGWGGREQEDIRTGIEALIRDGIAQAGKVGMTGTSYGGYSSWHGVTHFASDILAASAPICGMTDLVVDYHTTRPDLRPYSEEMLGGRPDEVPETYHTRSPINFVQGIKGRLMIVQGMQDPNVTPENVNTVVKALQSEGIEYELLAFDDEGHGIIKSKNQKRLLQQLDRFFGDAFTG